MEYIIIFHSVYVDLVRNLYPAQTPIGPKVNRCVIEVDQLRLLPRQHVTRHA